MVYLKMIDNDEQPKDMKRILLPIDFSEQSINCLEYAESLANAYNSELLILHVYGRPKAPEDMSERLFTESGVIDRLKNFVETNQTKKSNVNIKYLAQVGFAAEIILSVSKNEKIDLIVLGTHGTSNILNRYFGGVSLSIMNKAQCPILLIPPSVRFIGWNHLGCTINFAFDDLVALNTVIKWSDKFNADMTCLHVLDDLDEKEVNRKLNLLQELFSHTRITFKTKIGSLEETIELFEVTEELSVLAMIHRPKNLIGHLLHSDASEAAAEHLKVPLLIFNVPK